MPFDPISYALAKNAMKYSKSIKPDWEVIAEVEVEADCDYVEFTGLDINSDKVYVIFYNIKNPLSSDVIVSMYVNGDLTDTDYYEQYILANGTSISNDRINNPAIDVIYAGTQGIAVIFILLDVDGYARAIALCNKSSPSDVRALFKAWVRAVSDTNITSIRLQSDLSGGIGAGSKFILARVKRP